MKKVLSVAWPIMASYVPLGLACGVLGAKCGIDPVRSTILSLTTFTGGGQFMINNLWLAGMPPATIIASCGAIALRFALYSASLAPYLQGTKKRTSLALSATLIEEAYGVSLSRFAAHDPDWTHRDAFALNVVTILTWVVATAVGAGLGGAIDVPTGAAAFTMTALFIYLLMGQLGSRRNALAAAVAAVVVVACKLAGAATVAIPVAAVAGVAVAFTTAHAFDKRRAAGSEASEGSDAA